MDQEADAGAIMSRRMLFGVGAAAAFAAPALASDRIEALAPEPFADAIVRFPDELARLHALERIERTLDEEEVIAWYHFQWFSLVPEKSPRRLIRFEGIEMTRMKRLPGNRMETHGHNVSFPRTADGTGWLTEWENPFTGKTIKAEPNVIVDDPGHERGPAGVRSQRSKDFRPIDAVFRIEGDRIKIERIRQAPPNWPGQFVETSSTASPLDLFQNSRMECLPSTFEGMWVQPPPKWLDLGHPNGVLIGFFSGRKAPRLSNLPKPFRARLEKDYPDLVRVDPKKFKLT
jgi:hypothetical protein